MAKVIVPRSIAEAPTDRLRIGVTVDGQPRLLTGARAPTIGTGAGAAAARTPSAYLLGAQDDAEDLTTIDIVMRALVGTQLFKYLDNAARNNDEIALDFRTWGKIRNLFPTSTVFELKARSSSGGASGLYEIGTPASQPANSFAPSIILGEPDGSGNPETLVEGGVLEWVAANTSQTDKDTMKPSITGRPYNPEFIVITAILYDSSKKNPKAYVESPHSSGSNAASGYMWPNDGATSFPSLAAVTGQRIAHRDQSVRWTARGTAQSFQPGFGEASALYTLSVQLTEAMPQAQLIHSADADWANPSYS